MVCRCGAGFLSKRGRDEPLRWNSDGTISGVTPADRPIEEWYLAEKHDEPPPALPDGYEHLHPPALGDVEEGMLYLSANEDMVFRANSSDEFTLPRWIVKKSKPEERTITLYKWLYYDGDCWCETDWNSNIDWMSGVLESHVIDEKTHVIPVTDS